jgi:hypothetical protein
MTLAIIIFLLATAVLMLITIPFVMMILEIDENFWVNVRFWAVVATAWAVVWFAVSYGA